MGDHYLTHTHHTVRDKRMSKLIALDLKVDKGDNCDNTWVFTINTGFVKSAHKHVHFFGNYFLMFYSQLLE